MNAPRQPPLLGKANDRPPPPNRRRLNRFIKVGILIMGLLLLAQVWPQFQDPQGRRALWTKTVELLRSMDTYIFAGALLFNSLLYSLIVFYFSSAQVLERLGHSDAYSAMNLKARKREVLDFVRHALFVNPNAYQL